MVCIAAVIMALNIKSFVRTGGLYPGGATGLALLIQRSGAMFFHVTLPYTVINVALNAVPVYIGFRYIGRKFTLYSCLMIVLTSVLTDILPGYVITYDTLLISIFGGLINGFVISLCLHMNATTGGTDFIAIFLSGEEGHRLLEYSAGAECAHPGGGGCAVRLGQGAVLHHFPVQPPPRCCTCSTRSTSRRPCFAVTNRAEAVLRGYFRDHPPRRHHHRGAGSLRGQGEEDRVFGRPPAPRARK